MKTILAAALTFLFLHSSAQQGSFFADANNFFQSYVINGLVKYDSLKKNPSTLNALVRTIENYRILGKLPEEQKAFYTNAYNILVIKQIVDNYPVKGPMEITGFFNQKTFRVAGQTVTLDQLEKDMLFPAFPDPRLHFVLVCAAIGCPPLAGYAYVPDSLERQLEYKTTEILNINWYVRVYKEETKISKVFEWYEPDFVNDTTTVKSFINRYRTIPIPDSHSLEPYEYDWSLNDSKNSFRY